MHRTYFLDWGNNWDVEKTFTGIRTYFNDGGINSGGDSAQLS